MTEQKPRRVFTRDFKIETVELYRNSAKTATEIAHDLGIRKELIYRWNSEYAKDHEYSFPGAGHLKDPEEEKVRSLEKELRGIKEERDILKKALAIFSKVPR